MQEKRPSLVRAVLILLQIHCMCVLLGAGNVLIAGAEKMKTSQNEAARNRTVLDFHIELLRLRQNWRLKKVSNTIIGDLSYRTAGSKYLQTGTFEVSFWVN